jgi:hypothetical protein
MSSLIVPGGRPVPKKEEPKGPRVVSWANIVTIADNGVVAVTPYDSDFAAIHCQRRATPEDVVGASAYIEYFGPTGVDSLLDLGDNDDIFKTAFILGCMPNGHIVVLDDLFETLVATYTSSRAQNFMAAAIIRSRISATMTAEMTAPLAAEMSTQATLGVLDQVAANQQAAMAARKG